MDFPTLFYRSPGVHNAGGTATYDYIAVPDEERAEALIEEGWHSTLPGALDVHAEEPSDRALLETEAKRLGVSFNWKTSDEVLIERITAAKE